MIDLLFWLMVKGEERREDVVMSIEKKMWRWTIIPANPIRNGSLGHKAGTPIP